MQNRFDTAVAVTVAAVLGVVAFFLVGMQVFVWTVLFVPWLPLVVLCVGALGAGMLLVRDGPSAKGFGAGMLAGWVLLGLWTGGFIPR